MKNKRPRNIETPENNDVLDCELWNQFGLDYARVYKGRVVYVGSTDRSLRKRIRRHLMGISTAKGESAPAFHKAEIEK